jgi:hypothetical protein
VRTIIFGDPNTTDLFVPTLVACPWTGAIEDVITGVGGSIERQAIEWANRTNRTVTKVSPPDWKQLGKEAGPDCLRRMCSLAHAAIVIPDPDKALSKRCEAMLTMAARWGLEVYVYQRYAKETMTAAHAAAACGGSAAVTA